MKAHFENLSARTWVFLLVPAALIAYPLIAVAVPALVRAIVPDAVRTVLHLM
jgi:hypothetical protein